MRPSAARAPWGRADRLGTIKPGLRVDLIALDLSDPAYRPLNSVARQVVYADSGRSIRQVWVDGRRVVRDGHAALVDEKKLAADLMTAMPAVTRELARLRAESEKVLPAFAEIYRRAWATDLGYDRYLQRN